MDKTKSKIHTLPNLKDNRKQLRRSLTPAEARLWLALKNSQLQNRKFIRQHSIENYIADFYCASEKLVVELDGQVHFNVIASANDAERDLRLRELGIRVIRFENKLVFNDIEGLLREIVACFNDGK